MYFAIRCEWKCFFYKIILCFKIKVMRMSPVISEFKTPVEAMLARVVDKERLTSLVPTELLGSLEEDSPEFFYTLHGSRTMQALDSILYSINPPVYEDDCSSCYILMSDLTNESIESWVMFAELVGKRYGKDCCDFNDDSFTSIYHLLSAVAQVGIKIPTMAPDMEPLQYIQGDDALDKYFKMLFQGEWCEYSRFFIEYFEMCAELYACWGHHYVKSNYINDDIADEDLARGWEDMHGAFGLLVMAHADQDLLKRLSHVPSIVLSTVESYFEVASMVVQEVAVHPLESQECRKGVMDMLRSPKELNYCVE